MSLGPAKATGDPVSVIQAQSKKGSESTREIGGGEGGKERGRGKKVNAIE